MVMLLKEAIIGEQKAGKWLLRVGTGHKSYVVI